MFVNATSILEQENDPQGIAFSNDGAKMFVIGFSGKDVNEYDLHSVYPITVAGTSTVLPAGAFVTTWNVDTSPYTISIPLEVRSSGTITIDWGDGNTTDVIANSIQSHAVLGPQGLPGLHDRRPLPDKPGHRWCHCIPNWYPSTSGGTWNGPAWRARSGGPPT